MIEISVLEARMADGTLLWADGCAPDGYSMHQVIVPTKSFSERELELIESDSYEYPWVCIKNYGSGYIALPDGEAYDCSRQYDNFTVSIKRIEYK